MLEIAHLREFAFLVETMSFKQTAEQFYVSRSVISRHLAALEEQLGAKLVKRDSHGMQLTEAGKTFYRDTLAILRATDTAFEHVRLVRQAQARIVRVGYLRNAARPVIVRFVRSMKQRHPEINLTPICMEYNELRSALEEGTIDIALAMNVHPGISRNYRSTPIYTDSFFAVMSKDDPLAKSEQGVLLSDVPENKILLPDGIAYSGLSDLIDKFMESKSQVIGREYYRDIDMLYLKVQTEGFVALSSGLNNAMFGDQLAIVPILDFDSTFSMSAFYRHGLDDEICEACASVLAPIATSIAESGPGFTFESFL